MIKTIIAYFIIVTLIGIAVWLFNLIGTDLNNFGIIAFFALYLY